jgi:hypothetical protein
VVPIRQWSFTAERRRITLAGGFAPGYSYGLVYVAQDAAVVGLGLAAVRDMMASARYAPDSPFPVDLGLGFGVSQSGRFLRHFLYQGFNTDEQGRKVFDGLFIHAAGAGRGSFNHPFAQPSRDAHRYSSFLCPTDLFPFTGRSQRDPLTGYIDGLFAHTYKPGHLPKVIQTNTGYDYWGRTAALIHTSVDGRKDMDPLPNERIYHLAAAQHFVGDLPPADPLPGADLPADRGNPLDFRVNLRALLVQLVDWIRDGRNPPESRYPQLEDSTLTAVSEVGVPELPGIATPRVAHEAYRLDYGPRWDQGIIDLQPPRVGAAFPARVSTVDGLGNELGGIRNVTLRVPLATYYPWGLRSDYPARPEELLDFIRDLHTAGPGPARAYGGGRPPTQRPGVLPGPGPVPGRVETGGPVPGVRGIAIDRGPHQGSGQCACPSQIRASAVGRRPYGHGCAGPLCSRKWRSRNSSSNGDRSKRRAARSMVCRLHSSCSEIHRTAWRRRSF